MLVGLFMLAISLTGFLRMAVSWSRMEGVAVAVKAMSGTFQPLGQRSNCCRSRKSIRGHIPMYNFLPVYILYFLQALTMEHFTSTTPNKDQKVEQLFCCPSVPDL